MIEPKKRSFQQIPFWELWGEFRSQGWFDKEIADEIGMSDGTMNSRIPTERWKDKTSGGRCGSPSCATKTVGGFMG